jgi:uncharacterized protein (DUF2147 family)
MNTIKTSENLTIILPVMKDKQVITLHNVAKNETYIFKSEIKEVEIEIDIKKSQYFDFWDSVNPKEVEAIKEAIKKATEAKTKRWKPKSGEDYLFWNGYEAKKNTWIGKLSDDALYETGNIYRLDEEELLLWEQVTRRKYETALWDAADWVEGDWYGAFFDKKTNSIKATNNSHFFYDGLPRFATEQSAIDAHTRILGDDAERYFKGRR